MRNLAASVTRARGAIGVSLLCLAPVACESTPQPVTPIAAPPVAATAAPTVGPAEEPADLVGVARWKNPAATINALSSCANLPAQLAEGGTKAALELLFGSALRGQVDAKQLAAVVAMDASVDAVMALDPTTKTRARPIGAFSLGLTSMDRARAAAEAMGPVNEIEPGVFRIGQKRGDLTCAIAQAAGTAPARLVCTGGREKDLVRLAPFMARTLPTRPHAAADIHGELSWLPVDARFGKEFRTQLRLIPSGAQMLQQGNPVFDQALSEAARAITDELTKGMGDLDKATADLTVEANACLTFDASLVLRGKASWTAGSLTYGADRQGPPPAIFWRAPKESDSAFYGRGGDPARFEDIFRVLRGLAQGGLVKLGVPAADAKSVAEILKVTGNKNTNSVSSSGVIGGAPPKLAGAKPQQLMDAAVNAYIGWYLIGVDDSGDAVAKWLKDVVAAYNRKGVQATLRKALKKDASKLPTLKLVPAPGALGRGALDVEIRVADLEPPGGSKNDKVSVVAHVLLMPDGKGAWVGTGVNRDEIVKRMLAAKTGAPDSGTLAARGGLDTLKNGSFMSGGFVTIAPVTKGAGSLAAVFSASLGGMPPQANEMLNTMNNLPNKGQTPIFITTKVAPGDAPRLDTRVSVSKGTIEDVGALVTAAVRLVGALGGGKP